MSEPFIGEIRMVGFQFEPTGWFLCDGRLLPIHEYDALFALIGTTYGGNGQTTFGLPDLRGRQAVHRGQGLGLSSYTIGQVGGSEQVTLLPSQLPTHTHSARAAAGPGTSNVPTGRYWAAAGGAMRPYAGAPTTTAPMNQLTATGQSQPHENLPPYLVINFVIAYFGIFPSRN